MNLIDLFFKISCFVTLAYLIDLQLDGKIDLPHTTMTINYRRAWARIKKVFSK